jgi:signal peptidase I
VRDPYSVLGVDRQASSFEIDDAYHRLQQANAGNSNDSWADVELAYRTLSDPDRRARYDAFEATEPVARPPSPPTEEPPGAPFEPAPPPPPEPPRKQSWNPVDRMTAGLPRGWRITIDWLVTIAGAIAIVLAIKAWVVNPYRIPSSSMEPTLHCARPGSGCLSHFSDRVLANRFIYHFRSPHRGEIIVFKTPPAAELRCGAGGTFVKRLIGLPGERFEERNGYVYINGKKLNEPYIKPDRRDTRTIPPMRIPNGRYFMMGDNRIASCDSREWGPVPRKNIIGKVFFIYWPPNRISFVGAAIAFMGIAAFGAHRLARNFR